MSGSIEKGDKIELRNELTKFFDELATNLGGKKVGHVMDIFHQYNPIKSEMADQKFSKEEDKAKTLIELVSDKNQTEPTKAQKT